MARIDHWHTQMPGIGTRKLVRQLKNEGFAVGRKLVRCLMGEMGIQAIYPQGKSFKTKLSRDNCAVFTPKQGCFSSKSGLVYRHHIHQNATWPYVIDGHHRLVQPHDRWLEPVRHPGYHLCDSGGQGRRGSAWDACNSKLRSGLSVYQQRLQNAVEGASHPAEYGRKVPVGGQRDD